MRLDLDSSGAPASPRGPGWRVQLARVVFVAVCFGALAHGQGLTTGGLKSVAPAIQSVIDAINGQTITPSSITVSALTITGGTILHSSAGPSFWNNGATSTSAHTSSLSAANAGATPGTALYSFFPQNALDAADWLLSLGTVGNAASVFSVDYEGDTVMRDLGARISTASSQVAIGANACYTVAGGECADVNATPTVVACSGTAASITSSNATAVIQFDVGTSCAGESTATLTLPTATTGWICTCSSTTADRMIQQKAASSTTAVVLTNVVISTGAAGDFTDGADVFCLCRGY